MRTRNLNRKDRAYERMKNTIKGNYKYWVVDATTYLKGWRGTYLKGWRGSIQREPEPNREPN